jgi:hypothetical protein
MYGDATGHWERWSYLWALLPGAAGVASIVYGAVSARRDLILVGLRTVVVASVLFVAGMWFFETTFETGQAPIDLATWWPAILIALGALVMLSALLTRPATRNSAPPDAIAAGSSKEEQQ